MTCDPATRKTNKQTNKQTNKHSSVTYTRVTLIKMAFSEDHGRRILDQILASEGLAHIAENFFDQLDGESLENCELVCKSWRQFIINNGLKFWKKQYLQKLAKPGTDAHRRIKSNPKLFQLDQSDQEGIFLFLSLITNNY
jgi:hypothetical protein